MMNQKGQGITEYGIVFLLGVSLCILIWFSFGLSESSLKIDSLVAVRTQNVLNSKPGDTNYDLTTEVSQMENNSRKTPAYDTSLAYSCKDKSGNTVSFEILYRYEGRQRTEDGKDYVLGTGQYKVYTFKVSNIKTSANTDKAARYTGSLGLMRYTYYGSSKSGDYDGISTGAEYIMGEDEHGQYRATFFSIDGTIYQIRDYHDNETVLTAYTGDPKENMTVYKTVKGTVYTADQMKNNQKTEKENVVGTKSISDLADDGNALINSYLKNYYTVKT